MADTTDLKNVLESYVAQISNDLLKAQANLALDNYIAAENAYANIVASAATSYSDARGTINKDAAQARREEADRLYDRLRELLELGGVDLPATDVAVAYWDLSGFGGV